MDIKKARELLGKESDNIGDEEILRDIEATELLADIAIDTILKMSPKKRKALEKKLKKEKLSKKEPSL